MVFFLGLLARYFWSLTYTWGYISYGFVLALGKLSLNVLVQYSLSFYCEIHPILLALIEVISSLMYTNSSICKFKREILKLVLNAYIFRINQLVEDILWIKISNLKSSCHYSRVRYDVQGSRFACICKLYSTNHALLLFLPQILELNIENELCLIFR